VFALGTHPGGGSQFLGVRQEEGHISGRDILFALGELMFEKSRNLSNFNLFAVDVKFFKDLHCVGYNVVIQSLLHALLF
jgi:hypothetical protein